MKTLIPYNRTLKSPSRQLRGNLTDAERKIWSKIRNDQIAGLRFYRQKPIGNYIVDFFCPKIKLVVEIDGGQHYEMANEKRDKIRSDYLKSCRMHILRFSNLDVLNNIEAVIQKIYQEINPS